MATIHGNVLRGFINGEEVISATDDVFESGSPGIGFNFFVGNTTSITGSRTSRWTPTTTE